MFFGRHGKYWLKRNEQPIEVSSYDFYHEASKSTNVVEEIEGVFATFKIIRDSVGHVIGSCKEATSPR